MSDSRDKRTKNEALFQQLNQRFVDVVQSLPSNPALPPESVEFLCECGSNDCTMAVKLSMEAYRGLTVKPGEFIILPHHEQNDIDTVIDQQSDYYVIRKINP